MRYSQWIPCRGFRDTILLLQNLQRLLYIAVHAIRIKRGSIIVRFTFLPAFPFQVYEAGEI